MRGPTSICPASTSSMPWRRSSSRSGARRTSISRRCCLADANVETGKLLFVNGTGDPAAGGTLLVLPWQCRRAVRKWPEPQLQHQCRGCRSSRTVAADIPARRRIRPNRRIPTAPSATSPSTPRRWSRQPIRAPFFHNNLSNTLEEVVAFYAGPVFNGPRAPAARFAFNATQIEQLTDFMRALNSLQNIQVATRRVAGDTRPQRQSTERDSVAAGNRRRSRPPMRSRCSTRAQSIPPSCPDSRPRSRTSRKLSRPAMPRSATRSFKTPSRNWVRPTLQSRREKLTVYARCASTRVHGVESRAQHRAVTARGDRGTQIGFPQVIGVLDDQPARQAFVRRLGEERRSAMSSAPSMSILSTSGRSTPHSSSTCIAACKESSSTQQSRFPKTAPLPRRCCRRRDCRRRCAIRVTSSRFETPTGRTSILGQWARPIRVASILNINRWCASGWGSSATILPRAPMQQRRRQRVDAHVRAHVDEHTIGRQRHGHRVESGGSNRHGVNTNFRSQVLSRR